MNNYDLHVAALRRYYQKIGCSDVAALRAAYEDADALRDGKDISPGALAAIPDPVGKGLASSINFIEDAGLQQTRAQMNKRSETEFRLQGLASEVIWTDHVHKKAPINLCDDGSSKYRKNSQKESLSDGKSWSFSPSEVYPKN